MCVNPLVFVIAPVLGFITIGVYKFGTEEFLEEFPTFFSFVFGTLSAVLISLVFAGLLCDPKFAKMPWEVVVPVVFVPATILVSIDLSLTNNKVIDSILLTLFVVTVFTFVILGFLYFMSTEFPWKALIIRSSIAIFLFRIVVWIGRK